MCLVFSLMAGFIGHLKRHYFILLVLFWTIHELLVKVFSLCKNSTLLMISRSVLLQSSFLWVQLVSIICMCFAEVERTVNRAKFGVKTVVQVPVLMADGFQTHISITKRFSDFNCQKPYTYKKSLWKPANTFLIERFLIFTVSSLRAKK